MKRDGKEETRKRLEGANKETRRRTNLHKKGLEHTHTYTHTG